MERRYAPVDQCIYCGTCETQAQVNTLTDEHIIPFGLGGNLVLPKASCTKCQRLINKQIETPILHKEWVQFRDKHRFPTRRPQDRTHRDSTLATATDGSDLKVPLLDYSTPVPLYLFSEPRVLSNKPLPTLDHHWTMAMLTDEKAEVDMQRKYPQWNRVHSIVARPHLFARMLAKIAHGYAIAEYGKSTLEAFEPLLPNVIRGITGDWTQTVGGMREIPPPTPGGDHIINLNLKIDSLGAYLLADVRLFSSISMPQYHVVVGRIDFQNSRHIRALENHKKEGKLR